MDLRDYLPSLKLKSPSTKKNYRHYLREYASFAGNRKLDLDLIKKYRLYLSRKGLKKSTQNYFLIALRDYIKFLKERQSTSLEPSDISLYHHPKPNPRLLSRDEVETLILSPKLANVEGYRDRLILRLLSLGLGVSKIWALNREEVDKLSLDSHTFWLTQEYLKQRKDSYNPLFIRYKGRMDTSLGGEKMRLSVRSIERMVKKHSSKVSVCATPQILKNSA